MRPDGKVAWITSQNGEIIMEPDAEPMATRKRRAAADLLMGVPDDSQL